MRAHASPDGPAPLFDTRSDVEVRSALGDRDGIALETGEGMPTEKRVTVADVDDHIGMSPAETRRRE